MIPSLTLFYTSNLHLLIRGKDVKMDTGDTISKSTALSLALSRLSFPLISSSLSLLFFPPSLPLLNPLLCAPVFALSSSCGLPVEVASSLGNSVRRLKGGNYIHAAWPLWTLSLPYHHHPPTHPPLPPPCLLIVFFFSLKKGPHWHLGDAKAVKVPKSVCARSCVKRHVTMTRSMPRSDPTLFWYQLNWQYVSQHCKYLFLALWFNLKPCMSVHLHTLHLYYTGRQ